MFTAMILACAILPSGEADYNNCMVLALPQLTQDLETCVGAIQAGIPAIEQRGALAVDYECYDWKKKGGTKL
jgi:hypothetical protein